MGLTVNSLRYDISGSQKVVRGRLAFDSSYLAGGESLQATTLGLSRFTRVELQPEGGYSFETIYSSLEPTTVLLKVWRGGSGTTGSISGGTPAGTNSTSAVTGTAAAQTFTGTASVLNLASPVFSGTGLTAAGQVITTTSTHTMTLNQCAGMWLISATGATPPNLILSNTAVTGAPAVLTVQGAASTDAGAYKIVATIPVGTNAASASLTATAAAQTFTGSALAGHTHTIGEVAGGEVDNATDLSALNAIEFVAYGY